MSLFGSIQIANNALFAAQTGLQVTGNNIANANTPGYIRQRAVLKPATTQRTGDLALGLGVQVEAIVQQADRFLAERLRAAESDLANSEAQERSLLQLEALIGELDDTDFSTSLNEFFASLHNTLNQPEDATLRNLAVLQGQVLTDDLRRLDERVQRMRTDFNDEIAGNAEDINRLLEQVADLNVKIVVTEGGGTSKSEAVGLRDQREIALAELSRIVGIRSVEQPDGSTTVFAGGDFLVFQGRYRPVSVSYETEGDVAVATLHVADSDSPLHVSTGKLAGQYAARDEILGGFLDRLDQLAGTLAFEFNKLYASGQGLSGYEELTSEFAVDDETAALDGGGLPFTPVHGSFQVLVRNQETGLTRTTDVPVSLNGLDDDTSLEELATALDAIDGVQAEITTGRRLVLRRESPGLEFGFARDTSGVLAALGLNTFFTGSSADELGVNSAVRADPSKFATSQGGFGADAENLVLLADFADRPLDSQNGQSVAEFYEQIVAETTQSSAVTQAVTEGFRVFRGTLEGEQLGISGVNLDDELVNMITYQRTYQATARFIAAIGELLNVLVNL